MGFGSFLTSSGVVQPVSQPQIRYGGGFDGPGSQGNGPGITALQSRPIAQPQQSTNINKFREIFSKNPKIVESLKILQKKKGMARGGRVRYADGSQPQITQQQIAMIVTMLKKGADMSTISSIVGIPQEQIQMIVSKIQQGMQQKTPGGIAGYSGGGMSSPRSDPNPDAERNDLALKLFGRPLHQLTPEELDQLHEYIMNKQAKGGIMEIDYRDEGGFVPPIGKKERADDIPAMLSNNEFVFTADAVRNAGGGSVKEGAKKMYALMKKLEGK